MGAFQKRLALAIVLTSILLLTCDARVASGDPPSSTNAAETAVEERVAAPGECSEDAVVVSQDKESPMPSGITSYSVTIANTCLGCTVRNVHVSCGKFASTELVDPSDFRRVAVGDCLVRDGGAMGPGDTVSFEYSNSFPYEFGVASVSCS